jgi:hemerythrin superfamily protein
MSIFDKAIDAMTPRADDKAKRTARTHAQALATPGDWLFVVLQHHRQIEAAFDLVLRCEDPDEREEAQRTLAVLLTGHANAEESVLYPALARIGARGHAGTAYSEQAEAKMEMAALELLTPLTDQYRDKLLQIRDAVTHHMYEEESQWFLQLREKVPASADSLLTLRYEEEFDRYVAGDGLEVRAQDPPFSEAQASETSAQRGAPPQGR